MEIKSVLNAREMYIYINNFAGARSMLANLIQSESAANLTFFTLG